MQSLDIHVRSTILCTGDHPFLVVGVGGIKALDGSPIRIATCTKFMSMTERLESMSCRKLTEIQVRAAVGVFEGVIAIAPLVDNPELGRDPSSASSRLT